VAVSDTPWSNFTQADYTDQQWARACLIDTGQGTGKQRYKLPVREPSGALNRNGVHAAAGGHGISAVQGISADQRRAAAKTLVGLYRNQLKEDPPEGLMSMAGMATSSRSDGELLPVRACSRAYQLEDMTIRSDGSGRVVESYFAVFQPVRSEVRDQDGHYFEENARTLVNKTLQERGLNIPVFYNHARTLDGTPTGELSIPIGTPLEINPDERGVFNAVDYLDNPLADSILNGIKRRAIRGMSYSGRFIKSVRSRPPGSRLPLIVRHEADLREFGPTALPQFPEAEVIGTRAQQFLRMVLAAQDDPAILALLGQQFEGLTTPVVEPEALPSDTPESAGAVAVTDEPPMHSARSIPLRTRIRAARIARGWE
jgi:HK97 family phage prohead protease